MAEKGAYLTFLVALPEEAETGGFILRILCNMVGSFEAGYPDLMRTALPSP